MVLDEADRMFDTGFQPQMMRVIDNIRGDGPTYVAFGRSQRINQ